MTTEASSNQNLLAQLDDLAAPELRRLLKAHLTERKLGLHWEADAIARDKALNSHIVFPRLVPELSQSLDSVRAEGTGNLIIEGDNYDSLRLLKSTHAGKIRVIYIDPPYNTGNKDWVYNDRFVGQNDRWRHSQWLEFLYRRLLLAKDLLTSDGVIMVSINDENRARLEMLMDEVMPGRRIGSFVWRTRQGSNDAKGGFLSVDHESVLIYGNARFQFAGEGRDETKYSNPDGDVRGDWGSQMLIKNHNAKERPEAYYPLHNSDTDVWYLCDPDSVWRFASISRPLNKKKLQASPMEVLIDTKQILWPANEQTIAYASKADLLQAIKKGSAPKQFRIYLQLKELEKIAEKDVKVARLLTYIEPLENWVGRKLGFGRPRYKRFRENLQRDTTPLSSWLQPMGEAIEDDEVFTIQVGTTSEGTSLLRKIIGNKDFPYPKPLSLIQGLIQQASQPNDTVLDFFAGSGTTGHAVLALNAADGGNRKFILCSSTEANTKEPDKNLCRDVCAARMRKVIELEFNEARFAYVQLDKIRPQDVAFDATERQAFDLLTLRVAKVARLMPHITRGETVETSEPLPLQVLAFDPASGLLTVLCYRVTVEVLETLAAMPENVQAQTQGQALGSASWGMTCMRVYSTRQQSVRDYLEQQWTGTRLRVESLSLNTALKQGQIAPRRFSKLKMMKSTNEVAA